MSLSLPPSPSPSPSPLPIITMNDEDDTPPVSAGSSTPVPPSGGGGHNIAEVGVATLDTVGVAGPGVGVGAAGKSTHLPSGGVQVLWENTAEFILPPVLLMSIAAPLHVEEKCFCPTSLVVVLPGA